jgi:hypothetical protein
VDVLLVKALVAVAPLEALFEVPLAKVVTAAVDVTTAVTFAGVTVVFAANLPLPVAVEYVGQPLVKRRSI